MSGNQRNSINSQDRKLRYKALLENLSSLEVNSADNEEQMEVASNAVKEAQSLLSSCDMEERARHPGEGFLDSRVLRATSGVAVRCSEAVSGNAHAYDRHELAAHIKENPSFWTFPLPKEAPVSAYLFGAFAPTAPERRERAERRRAPRDAPAELTQPEDVDKLEQTEENSEMVSRVKRFITKACRGNGGAPLSYFRVVLDPTSFARTVENVYYVSFLARDQIVSLDVDEKSRLPVITPVAAAQREGELQEKQLVVSIDMQRWKDMVEALNIKTPMMVLKRE